MMGAPAPIIPPAAEVAAGEAARQTARFVLIEGGKATVAEVAGEGLLATVGSTMAAVAVGLLVLLWPSEIGEEPIPYRVPEPSPEPDDDIEECSEGKCPPHEWREIRRKTPRETMNQNQKFIEKDSNSPSMRNQVQGKVFENYAIEENGKRRPIEATSVEYVCCRCLAEQEVDVLFRDGQIAEVKSASAKTVQKKSEQAARYRDIQEWLNRRSSMSRIPLGKLDGSRLDVEEVAQIYQRRGHEVEKLF